MFDFSKRQNVTFICSPPLLDNAIEQIKLISENVDLDVLIFVSVKNPNSAIFQIIKTNCTPGIYDFRDCGDIIEYYFLYKDYLHRCKSVKVVFFSNSIIENIKIYRKVFKLTSFQNSVIHFDDVSGISLIVMIRFFHKSIILNVHDPIPHSGENSILKVLIKKIAFLLSNNFVVYSKFALNQFIKRYGKKRDILQLQLLPYSFYPKVKPNENPSLKFGLKFLFFGRISPYKGIQELIDAFNIVSRQFPEITLTIAGKGDLSKLNNIARNVFIKNHFIDLEELSTLFTESDVLVCPYRDATQSGVIMTARAFNLPTIVSNVGALPENSIFPELIYDINDQNGLVTVLFQFIESIDNYRKNKKNVALIESNISKLVSLYNKIH